MVVTQPEDSLKRPLSASCAYSTRYRSLFLSFPAPPSGPIFSKLGVVSRLHRARAKIVPAVKQRGVREPLGTLICFRREPSENVTTLAFGSDFSNAVFGTKYSTFDENRSGGGQVGIVFFLDQNEDVPCLCEFWPDRRAGWQSTAAVQWAACEGGSIT